ncbi:hypothetical protein GGI12_004385 [Dipsacomyces acuminosporus]|nr:hypothetical protein GGI12_004385 [Dipsacomyces acuminosporus]
MNRTAAQAKADQLKRTPSAATHGTVLKGLNIYKDGKDPVALKDEEYPEWLWTLLDEVPEESMNEQYPEWLWTLLDEVPEGSMNERTKQRLQRSKAIKESNFMKSKKK